MVLKKKKKLHRNANKGFSLVEVLIAVGVLALVIVPLAMNMISSSQINSKAKQEAASSDLTTSILEVMQTVDLSDILTDMNGYSTDEYGEPLSYTITGIALKDFEIGQRMEMIANGDGTFSPVANQLNDSSSDLPKASISIRNTGDVIRSYFVGQKSGKYAFVISDVENDEMRVDIVATITPKQTLDIVNITSMAQTEVVTVKDSVTTNKEMAQQFALANETYRILKGNVSTIPVKDAAWFSQNMKRTITVDIKQDVFSESTTITVVAEYTVDEGLVREVDRTITKVLGTYTTNSTAEFARGVYVYYYPMKDIGGSASTPADNFIINNKNELSTPVYLIALAEEDDDNLTVGYHPSLSINELSDVIYKNVARTTVCSNINNTQWTKTVYPVRTEDFIVKTLGNSSLQQTLYEVVLQVYNHREDSYGDDGKFSPREKDLLTQIDGTFIDTSEIIDIDSDKTTGLTETPGIAYAGKYAITYSGEVQNGVYGSNVDWTGTTAALNAGTYTATAIPKYGYTWSDGSSAPKSFTWVIERSPTATFTTTSHTYSAQVLTGVNGEFIEISGINEAYNAGLYTVFVTPDSNHAWDDGSYQTRAVKWRINAANLDVIWATGIDGDTWEYDGNTHYASYELNGIYSGDTCSLTINNGYIREVGRKTVTITGISNPNYSIKSEDRTHEIKVLSVAAAEVVFQNDNRTFEYDGQMRSIVKSSVGVYFGGTVSAKNAGTYNFTAYLMDGYTWEDGTDEPKTYSWTIKPRVVTLRWGESVWTYDGLTHSTTCVVTNAVNGEVITVLLDNNAIKNAGSQEVEVVGLSNKNYKLSTENLTHTITINRARLARYQTYNFQYDGEAHVGVSGQYIYKTGTTASSEVNIVNQKVTAHIAYVEPMENYAWADGSIDKKPVTWTIYPLNDAWYRATDYMYNSYEIYGVFPYYNIDYSGTIAATNIGTYTAILKPSQNHAWKDTGTVEERVVSWSIQEAVYASPLLEETVFTYDGEVKRPTITDDTANAGYYLSGDLSATNAGTYQIVASLYLDSGITWPDGSKEDIVMTWTILPKEVGVEWGTTEWTYDATTHTATATVTELCGSDQCVFYYSDNTIKDAGEKTAKITGLSNSNYKLPSSGLTHKIKVNPKTIGINWGTLEFTYNTEAQTVTPTATLVCTGDTVTLTAENNTHTDADEYTVKVTAVSNTNYKLPANVTATMIIKRSPTASITGTDRVYNGSAQNGYSSKAYVDLSGDSNATNAASYSFTATPSKNYAWSDGTIDAVTVNWTIKPNPIATIEPSDKTYNGSSQKGYKNDAHVTIVSGDSSATNAGDYSFKVRPSSNYAWKDGTGTGDKTISWNMAKASGQITAPTGKTLAYTGGAQVLVNAGSTSYGSVYYKLGSNGSWSTSLPTAINAGTYTIYYYSSGDSNHNATAEGYVTAQITVVQDAKVTTANRTYNENSQNGYSVATSVDLSGNYAATSAGSYTFYATPKTGHTWADDGSTEQRTFTWTMNKKARYNSITIDVIDPVQWDGYSHELVTKVNYLYCIFQVTNTATNEIVWSWEDSKTWVDSHSDYQFPYVTDPGTYLIEVRQHETSNYLASPISTAEATIIEKGTATVDIDVLLGQMYSNSTGKYSVSISTAVKYCQLDTGGTSITNTSKFGKTLSVFLKPYDGYIWSDGSIGRKKFTFNVNQSIFQEY